MEDIQLNAKKDCKAKGISLQNDTDVLTALGVFNELDDQGQDLNNKNQMGHLINWLFWDQEFAGNANFASAYHNLVDEYAIKDFGTEEKYVTDERGFNAIFEVMANEINVLTRQYRQRLEYPPDPYEDNRKKGVFTNFNVNQINYSDGQVFVEATNNSNGNMVRFEGDAIICTASVGVLKANLMQFNPPLPKWKTDAIDQIEMGNYVKIFCKFDKPWWKNMRRIANSNYDFVEQ